MPEIMVKREGYIADAWEGGYDERVYRRDIEVIKDEENPGFWVARYGYLEPTRAREPWRAEAFMHQRIAEQLLKDNTESPLEEETEEERPVYPPLRVV